jgi:hypothetical protein
LNTGVEKVFKDIAKRLPKESTNKKTKTLAQKQKEMEAQNANNSCGMQC